MFQMRSRSLSAGDEVKDALAIGGPRCECVEIAGICYPFDATTPFNTCQISHESDRLWDPVSLTLAAAVLILRHLRNDRHLVNLRDQASSLKE